jgi:hypothetical protein
MNYTPFQDPSAKEELQIRVYDYNRANGKDMIAEVRLSIQF